MSEKPITQRIKDRLAAYTAMLRDIDNQLERLDRMEMTMASPPGPDLTGMPRGSGTPSDRTGMMVERKMELEEQIDRLKAEEKKETPAAAAPAEKPVEAPAAETPAEENQAVVLPAPEENAVPVETAAPAQTEEVEVEVEQEEVELPDSDEKEGE